jgi:UDP-2,3-diacylglucosamine hydrolase
MTPNTASLGLIAGSRSLPLTLARFAREAGVQRLVAIAFEGETDPALSSLVEEVIWLKVGQLGKMIRVFSQRDIRQCVMAGQVNPKNLFDLRPDLRAISVLLRLKERNARTIFSAIADELHKEGIELVDARPWLGPVMPGAGYHLGPKLTASQLKDVQFGYRIAKEVSRLDIGQLVVVKKGTVLAVEGFEGTDECLRRGGELAGKDGGAIAVKVASEQHDFRFDIPCLGPRTLEVSAGVRMAALAFEAGKSLLLDRELVERYAVRHQLTLVAVG